MPELREHERLQLSSLGRFASTWIEIIRTATKRPSIGFVRAPAMRLAIVLLVLVFGSGCISLDLIDSGERADLVQTVVRGTDGPKILLVEIDGVIDGSNSAGDLFGLPEYSMVARIREELDAARKDGEIRAVLLRIDSPGGTATASEQIYTEIMRFRRERDVPVVAQFLSTAASGGYYIAMAADTIQAHPTSITGSIGVVFSSLSFAGLMEKIGVEDQTITGGRYKDAGSPYRSLTPVERAQLQAIVDDLHDRFREIVAEGRPELSTEQVDALSDGRIFSATQALDNGLIDRIGTLEDAVVELQGRLGVQSSRVIAYHRPREIRRNLYTELIGAPSFGSGLGSVPAEAWALRQLTRILGRPGFHYLWWPGISFADLGR